MPLFLPFMWIVAGFTLAAGVWCISGNIRSQHMAFLPFGMLAILVGLYLALTAEYYSASSLSLAQWLWEARFAVECCIFTVAVWFFGVYTRVRKPEYWLAAFGLVFAFLLIAYVGSKGGLFLTNQVMAPPIMVLGQPVHSIVGSTGPLLIYFYVAGDLVLLWALWRCIVMWRTGLWYKAWPLTAYLLLQVAALTTDQLQGWHSDKPFISVAQLAFLGLVAIMGLSLILETRRREEAFYKTVGALQSETAKRKHYETRLNYLATHDPLTDLPNRRLLRSSLDITLQQYQANGELGAIVFLDLDHFKTINDSLGHQIGDKLLILIAERLRKTLPASRVARLGGDEFAVVLGNLGQDRAQAEAAAMRTADALRDKLGEPFSVNEHQLSVGGSVGVAVFPDAEGDERTDVGALFRQADLALYRAKTSGRNRAALFAAQMQQDARLRLVIEEGLRTVLDRKELELYFQPQMDFHGQLIGAEVLLRWNHPKYGLVEPQQFIPVAEETGLIHDIGEFVLTSACRYLREWNEATMATPPRLAINVSPWQLATSGFARKVKRSLMRSDIDPGWLTLEITENAVLQDIAEVTQTILELSALGVRFSIDDFGSGYAALASLKRLPLHELKIDRLFVNEMRLDAPDQFISTIISMAENMGLYVIAEGVETEAQRKALTLLGCPGFQGYLISRPLNAREFMGWLRKTAAGPAAQLPPEPRAS